MSDTDIDQNLYDSDQEVAKHHSKLVEAVTQLDKRQRVKKAERSEPSLEVSEYHLVKSGATDKDVVRIRDLIKLLEQKGDQGNIIKKLRYIQQKNRVLPKPLEKPAAERIKRTVGYDKVKEELKKWDNVVSRNRTAEQLSFPLKRLTAVKDSHTSKIPEFLRGFNTKSDLMKKIEEVDPTLLYPADKEGEKDNENKMTLEKVILKRKNAARLRARQSYMEAKAHRQRKIKSKKFHRIQRKDKINQQLMDFERLKDSNPQEALAKLEQLDRARAEERMSLRHKNTGQWAKNKQIRAKYNKETRQVLAEQLAISRELTQRVDRIDSDEEDEENEEYVKDKEDKENEKDKILLLYQKCMDDKKQQMKKEKIEKNKISGEIIRISEKEKSTLCHNEKNNTSQIEANTNDTNSNCNNEENNILQTNTSNTKNKLHSNEESGILHANTNDTKNKCNEKSNLLAHTNNVKDKIRKRKKNKECSMSDHINVTNEHNDKKLKSQDINEMFDSKRSKKEKSELNLKMVKIKKKCKASNKIEKQNEEESEDSSPNLEFKNSKQKPILDSPLEETTFSTENIQKDSNLTSLKTIANTVQKPASYQLETNSYETEINLKEYPNVKPRHLKTQLPDMTTGGDEDSEQEEKTHQIMNEALTDEDIEEEFRKEKEEEMKKSQPQNIDMSLPGWGSWGGPNIKKNKLARKKSRFILTVPKVVPRKPENQGKVIVFEHENEKLKKHLVRELPYPFTRVKDFEASIRAPISRTFVPMNAHLRLIQPAVRTKLGQVIEPMDENELVKKQPMVKKPLKRITAKTDKKKNILRSNNKKGHKQNVQNV